MGKIQRFEIVTDVTPPVYYAGQVLSGRVFLNLAEPMDMRDITLEIHGKGHVSWQEHRHKSNSHHGSSTETVTYSSHETYVNHRILLWGNGHKNIHPAGQNVFPFSIILPPTLPSSFEGRIGHIRYYCKCRIDRPWKFDSISKLIFTVNASIDLNLLQQAQNRITQEDHKNLCCLCCRSGPISAVVSLDKTGYVPGESIYINAEVNNLSGRRIERSKAVLAAVIAYHATTKTRHDVQRITEVVHGAIESGDSDIWNGVPVHIPPLPPSNLGTSKIIDVQYQLQFFVEPSGIAFNLGLKLPIIIGTTPLMSAFGYFQMPPQYNGAIQPTAPPLTNQYPGLPPPSYAESVFGTVDGREEGDNEYVYGKLSYTPAYTYYNPR